MDKRSRNRVTMIDRLDGVFTRHQEAWENEPLMVQMVEQIRQKKSLIEDLLRQQETLNRSWSGVKASDFERFATDLLKLQGYLRILADRAGDKESFSVLDYVKSDFNRRGLQKAYNMGTTIVGVAEKYAEELKQFSDGEALAASCAELLDKGENRKVLIPSERKKQLKVTTEKLREVQDEVVKLLKVQVDAMMLNLGAKHPDFMREYDANRALPKYGSGKSSNGEDEVVDPVVLPPTPPSPIGELGGGDLPGLPGGDAPPGDDDDGGEG